MERYIGRIDPSVMQIYMINQSMGRTDIRNRSIRQTDIGAKYLRFLPNICAIGNMDMHIVITVSLTPQGLRVHTSVG